MKKKSGAKVRVAIIGTGGMAKAHVKLYREVENCEIVGGVDVDAEKAREFCSAYGIPKAYDSVDAMLRDDQVDAVSVVVPDAFHLAVTLQCLKANKHVLCEKPLALNYQDARRMVDAARKKSVVNMINFSYRNWSCIHTVAEIVQSGRLGEIRHVDASYYQSWLACDAWGEWRTNPNWLWRLSTDHGSKGVLGDIGVHIIDFATFPVGKISRLSCKLKTFKKAPRNRIGKYVLDANDSAVVIAEFKNGALGTIQTTRWSSGHINRLFLKVSGTLGSVVIDSDWSTDKYRICEGDDLNQQRWVERDALPVSSIHRKFIGQIIRNQEDAQPDFARGAEIQKILDTCFASNESGGWIQM